MKAAREKSERSGRPKSHVITPRGIKTVVHPRAEFHAHTRATAHFKVSIDPGLGATGTKVAEFMLQDCEQDFATLQKYFDGITPRSMPFHLIVTSGSTGASHATCLATALSIGSKSGPLEFMRSLVIAEEDEVFEANFGHGWNCGYSNGEGLSRVLANDMVPGVEPQDFVSPPVWLGDFPDIPGTPREDWVTRTDHTDSNYYSIGCSVLFLNWLRFQLGYAWKEIIAAGAPTLAGTYQNLTGKNDAWPVFQALVDRMFPSGKPSGLTTDNPFLVRAV